MIGMRIRTLDGRFRGKRLPADVDQVRRADVLDGVEENDRLRNHEADPQQGIGDVHHDAKPESGCGVDGAAARTCQTLFRDDGKVRPGAHDSQQMDDGDGEEGGHIQKEGSAQYIIRLVRIASLSPAVTETLFLLGCARQIVCRDQFSNFPEEAKKIPAVRDHAKVKPEDLLPFAPEIIFTSTVVQERLANDLRAQGFSVVHQDLRTIHQIYESIRAIGAIVGAEKESEALILKMQQGFNDVKKKARLMPRHPRLYIEEWPAFAPPSGATAGKHNLPFASGNWVPEIAQIAGGKQFPIPAGELSKEVSLEDVATFDPDLIVISWCGAGLLAPKDLLLKREGWGDLRAIKESRVRVIDDSFLNRPGPRLVEGAQRLYGWMFEMLH